MANKHPIIALTGASGAGTSLYKSVFVEVFHRLGLNAAYVSGDEFSHQAASQQYDKALDTGCYGPDQNDFETLEGIFTSYSNTGDCQYTRTSNAECVRLPSNTDLLLYEGLHGGVVAESWTRRKQQVEVAVDRRSESKRGINLAQYVDLLIGIVPAINLEWIQKIIKDEQQGKVSRDASSTCIQARMWDYVHFIVPQFSLTDINFQRVPVVDTANPFAVTRIPAEYESVIVIRFRFPEQHDFPYYMQRIPASFMSRRNTLVIPGGEMKLALDVICAPLIERICKNA